MDAQVKGGEDEHIRLGSSKRLGECYRAYRHDDDDDGDDGALFSSSSPSSTFVLVVNAAAQARGPRPLPYTLSCSCHVHDGWHYGNGSVALDLCQARLWATNTTSLLSARRS
jgi:hypothetical protein